MGFAEIKTWPIAAMQRPLETSVVANAATMRTWLRAREAQTNLDRCVSAETILAFKAAGFFRLVQPTRFGGFDADYDLCSQVVEELAMGCSSSAWVYGVLSLHSLFLSSWPDAVQDEVWGEDPSILISSSLAPRPVTRVDGGYRLSGGWSFSSGCDHAVWAMVGGVAKGEAPVLMLVPLSDITILDDWHTLGLRGTGSKTLQLDNVFVPERRAVPLMDIYAGSHGAVPQSGSFWHHAPQGLFGVYNFSSVVLGIVQRAADVVADMLRNKVSRGIRLSDVESYRMTLAEATSVISIARFHMHNGCRNHVANIRNGLLYTERDVSAVSRDIAVVSRQLRDTILSLSEISGGWIYDSDPMQQLVRDTLTAVTHRSASWEAKVLPDAAFILNNREVSQ